MCDRVKNYVVMHHWLLVTADFFYVSAHFPTDTSLCRHMLTRNRKRKLEADEAHARRQHELQRVNEKFRVYRQHRDSVVHRVVKAATRREDVCYRVFRPIPQVSLKHAWLSMLSDVCTTGYSAFQAQHPVAQCDTCRRNGRCLLSERFVQDYIQSCFQVITLAAQGVRSQVFVRASHLVMLSTTRACMDRWYATVPAHIAAHVRSIGMETVVTTEEAPILRRMYEMQLNAKQIILMDALQEDLRTSVKHYLTHCCMLVNQIINPAISATTRHALLQKANGSTHLEPSAPRGRSTLKEGASAFSGIRGATRHAVAQQRNLLTGADRLGMYWKP